MFKWKKLGRVFNPEDFNDRPWLNEFAQAPATLMLEDRLRVYFSCRPKPSTDGFYTSYTSYVDFHKDDPGKILELAPAPILELGGLGEFDEFGTYPVSVIRDGESILAYYAGWTRCESVPFNVAIGAARSFDNGKTFKKLGKGPILSYSLNEPFILSGPKIRFFDGQYHLFYISGRKWIMDDNGRPEPVYKIRHAKSNDGINWIKTDSDLIESRIEQDEAQASPDVFFLNDRYHMFFCYRYSRNYRCKEYGYRVGYAWSDDLKTWNREDESAGIDVSESGWDSEMISYPHIFQLNNKIYMYYLGNQVGRHGFGLAELEEAP